MTAPADLTDEEIAEIQKRCDAAHPGMVTMPDWAAAVRDRSRLLAALRKRDAELTELRELLNATLKHRDEDIKMATEIAEHERDKANAEIERLRGSYATLAEERNQMADTLSTACNDDCKHTPLDVVCTGCTVDYKLAADKEADAAKALLARAAQMLRAYVPRAKDGLPDDVFALLAEIEAEHGG